LALVSLLPLLMPGRIVASGQRPAQARELRIFRLVVGATLLGIPLLIFYLLARENVSGQAPPGKILKIHIYKKETDEGKKLLPRLKEVRLFPYKATDPNSFFFSTGPSLELRFEGPVDFEPWLNLSYIAFIVPNWPGGAR